MKKIFLSLTAIAMLAVGTVGCSSSDDSTPGPSGDDNTGGGELTENYFDVDGERTEAGISRWYVRTLGSNGDSPIREYILSDTDSTKYALFDLVTWSEDDSQLINVVYAVKIDESVPADSETEIRYYYPYTGGEEFGTFLYDAYHVVGQNDYAFGNDFNIQLKDLNYGTESMAYILSGTANNKAVTVDFDGIAENLYVMDDTPTGATNAKSSKPNTSFAKSKLTNIKRIK